MDDTGQASILEMSVILPLVMLVVLSLFFLGFFFLQSISVHVASRQLSSQVAVEWAKPNLNSVNDGGDGVAVGEKDVLAYWENHDPYRYLFGAVSTTAKEASGEAAKDKLQRESPLRQTEVSTEVKEQGRLFHRVEARVKVAQQFPVLSRFMDQPQTSGRRTSSVVVDQGELLRNLQFADALFQEYQSSHGGKSPIAFIGEIIQVARSMWGSK